MKSYKEILKESQVLKEDNKYLKDLSQGDYFSWELKLHPHTLTRLEHLVNTMNSGMHFLIDKIARQDYAAASRWSDDLVKVAKELGDCAKHDKWLKENSKK